MSRIIQNTDSKSFSQLLCGRMRIPLYQRFYEWEKDLIQQLCRDIFQALKLDKNIYLGAIISKEEHGHDVIIDGQQRILTLVILLRALCDYLIDKKGFRYLYKKIHRQLADADFDFEESSVIELNEESQGEFFKLCILKGVDAGGLQSQLQRSGQIFLTARKILLDEINEALSRSNITPGDLYKYINHRIEMIKIDLSRAANETEIFEAINSKRQELSVLDNIKNLFFKLSVKKNWDLVGEKWEKLRTNFLSARDFETFIAYFASASACGQREYTAKKPRILLKFFKDELGESRLQTGNEISWSHINSFFVKLEKYKNIFLFLTEPNSQQHNGSSSVALKCHASVIFSRNNKYTSHLPLLMRAAYQARLLPHKKVSDLLAIAELMHFEGRIDGTLPQKIKDKFFVLLKKLKKQSLASVIASAKKEVDKKKLSRKIAGLSNVEHEAAEQKIRYVLHRIISYNMPQFLVKNFDLEHIMPQNKRVRNEWKNIIARDLKEIRRREYRIKNSARVSVKKDFYYDRFVYSLGNCALFIGHLNRSDQDLPFIIKRKHYEEQGNNKTFQWVIKRSKSGWNYKKILNNSKWLANEYIDVVLAR